MSTTLVSVTNGGKWNIFTISLLHTCKSVNWPWISSSNITYETFFFVTPHQQSHCPRGQSFENTRAKYLQHVSVIQLLFKVSFLLFWSCQSKFPFFLIFQKVPRAKGGSGWSDWMMYLIRFICLDPCNSLFSQEPGVFFFVAIKRKKKEANSLQYFRPMTHQTKVIIYSRRHVKHSVDN